MASSPPSQLIYQQSKVLQGHDGSVVACKLCPHAGSADLLIASASTDCTAKIWNGETGECKATLTSHTMGICDVAWSHSGNYLCTASDDQTLRLWDATTGQMLKTLKGHTNYVFCCTFHPSDHLLVSGSFDETIRVWDVRSGKCLRAVPAHSDPVTAVDFMHDGSLILSCSLDGLLRIWDTASGHCLKTIYDEESPPLSSARFSPNGKFILAGSLDSSIRLWDIGCPDDKREVAMNGVSKATPVIKGGLQHRARTLRKYSGHENKQFCIFSAFCAPSPPRPPCIVTGSEEGSIYMYDISNRSIVCHIPPRAVEDTEGQGHCDAVLGIDTHPTEDLFISSGHDKDRTIRVFKGQRS